MQLILNLFILSVFVSVDFVEHLISLFLLVWGDFLRRPKMICCFLSENVEFYFFVFTRLFMLMKCFVIGAMGFFIAKVHQRILLCQLYTPVFFLSLFTINSDFLGKQMNVLVFTFKEN